MQKSTDYGLFIRTVSAAGREESGARSKAQFMKELKAEYPPEDGWRIVGVQFGGLITSEGYTVIFALQKFEDVSEDA